MDRVVLEVCIKPNIRRPQDLEDQLRHHIDTLGITYLSPGTRIPINNNTHLRDIVQSIRVDDVLLTQRVPLSHNTVLELCMFQLHEHEPFEEAVDESAEAIPACEILLLPNESTEGMWESLHYDTTLKKDLICYAFTSLLFSDAGVDSHIISTNRVVLLHGPPGTGKTSICKALAHKLSVRLGMRYPTCQFVEINAHSLFSKWFSESGKQVMLLFKKIMEIVEDSQCLVFVLIDEVESLAAARRSAMKGNEPSDAIRVVNALLTQLDRLRRYPNVMILTTSNLSDAVDVAFVDRADFKHYVGHPSLLARYQIVKSAVDELARKGLILCDCPEDVLQQELMSVCAELEGASGRLLRKLPFLTFSYHLYKDICGRPMGLQNVDVMTFVKALRSTVAREKIERSEHS